MYPATVTFNVAFILKLGNVGVGVGVVVLDGFVGVGVGVIL